MSEKGDDCPKYDDECPNSMRTSVVWIKITYKLYYRWDDSK